MVGSDHHVDFSELTKLVIEPPSERMHALKIAMKLLDRSGLDSEADLAILARQFIAGQELIERLEKDLRRWRTSEGADGRRL